MPFAPKRCPHPDCPSRRTRTFRCHRKGHFQRACDGRRVQRFLCRHCRRGFSTQTFRLDYRLQRPRLHHALFADFVSKVTHRQAARLLGCSRVTVAHRLRLLGEHCRAFQERALERARRCGGLKGRFQLDELETYEHSRRLQPLTVPVLIERHSYFVLHAETAPLPARGGLGPRDRERKAERERLWGKRRSGSRAAVGRCAAVLARVARAGAPVVVETDRKSSYPGILRGFLASGLVHVRQSSRRKRDYGNPLFPINHTLALLRDGLSRLVRRTWAASKLGSWLARHLWIWIAYRNFVRGITNRAVGTTPAMALGVTERRFSRQELLAWRVLP